MDGWRGIVVLTIGLAIGVGLWFGVVGLVEPPDSGFRAAQSHVTSLAAALQDPAAKPAQGVSGATAPSADLDSPPKPFPISQGSAELQADLDSAPYVHRGLSGPALYVVAFRSCPSCAEFETDEWSDLENAGVDIRWLVYARRDKNGQARSLAPERALVAELVLQRSYPLFDAWFRAPDLDAFYKTAQMPPPADSSPQRLTALETSRALVDSLSAITAANGQELEIPTFFWRDSDGWHAMVGYEQSAFASVKAALLASRQASSAAPPPGPAPQIPPEVRVITPPHATSAPPATPGVPQ
jgi:hypothetical protein